MKKEQIKITPTFEDEAHEVATFIQKLGHVCDSQLNTLFEKCKSNNWVEGMEDSELYDWLFDYCFNGRGNDEAGFEDTFSESINKCLKYEVE